VALTRRKKIWLGIGAVVGVIVLGLLLGAVMSALDSSGISPFGGREVTGKIVSVGPQGAGTQVCVRDGRNQECGIVPSIPRFTKLRVGDCAFLRVNNDSSVELERRTCPDPITVPTTTP
jgi:hypothetical protein